MFKHNVIDIHVVNLEIRYFHLGPDSVNRIIYPGVIKGQYVIIVRNFIVLYLMIFLCTSLIDFFFHLRDPYLESQQILPF